MEKKRARAVGARLHPNSGAGSIKDDASSEDALYEFKEANRSHTLDAAALRGLYLRAVRMDKDARYIVHFADGLVADVHLYTGRNHDG